MAVTVWGPLEDSRTESYMSLREDIPYLLSGSCLLPYMRCPNLCLLAPFYLIEHEKEVAPVSSVLQTEKLRPSKLLDLIRARRLAKEMQGSLGSGGTHL